MRFTMRLRSLRIALFFVAAFSAYAQDAETQAVAGGAAVDRLPQVLDTGADAGKLVARFWKMSLVTDSDDKSGDSTLIISPDGKTMLIDGGAPQCGSQVDAYLQAMGITRLDAVVASHPHVDHIGGLSLILRKYPVGAVYLSRVVYPTGVFGDFMAAVKASGAQVVYLEAGSKFSLGGSVQVEALNPEHDIVYYDGYPSNSTQFINNKSVVLRFEYGSSSMLFMGDVYTSHELDLIAAWGAKLDADALKMGHHGSDTSSSKSFIKAVTPKVAVAMHDNLASLSVYNNYRKYGADAFITCVDGCVKVSLDGAGAIDVVTEFERSGSFLQ